MFPPFNAIGAVRTSKTAKFLTELGFEVKVVSCANQSLAENLPLEIPEKMVRYTPWVNVNSPVEFFLGGKKKVAQKGFVPSSNFLPSWIKKLGFVYRSLINFPDGQIGWYPFACQAGNQIIRQWTPDLIYASAIPYTSLLVASSLSRRNKIPWIAELRDLWTDNPNRVMPRWRQYLEEKLERRVLSSASGLVTVSEPLAETLRSKYSIPCEVIRNGFDPEDSPAPSDIPFSNGVVRIVYTGQLYNCQQDPTPLFKALKWMGKESEMVEIHFYGRYLDFVSELALKYDVRHLIKTHEPVSYKESVTIQAQSDLLLLFPGYDHSYRGVYTGKLFEYLGARRPILSLGNMEGVAANLIREHSAGTTLTDFEQIAQQIRSWIKQKKDNGCIPFLPPKTDLGLTRKEQTKALARFLSNCLKNL